MEAKELKRLKKIYHNCLHSLGDTMSDEELTIWAMSKAVEKYANTKAIKCVAGCKHFTGGEIKHHFDCDFYPESLSKMYDDLESNQLKWIPIDKDNLPKGEVLIKNDCSDYIVGCINENEINIYGENEHEILDTATHYIDINKI